jgi:hypothetical protein
MMAKEMSHSIKCIHLMGPMIRSLLTQEVEKVEMEEKVAMVRKDKVEEMELLQPEIL